LTVRCPAGWDDVKKISNKVLTYDNRKFTFTGWNSDRNEAYFSRPYPWCGVEFVATISNK
jgi:hypothetical protein